MQGTMELDPRTLVVASLLLATLLGTVSLAFATVRGSSRIVGAWGKSMLLLAAGLLGLALRGAIPDWVSFALGNTVVVASLVLALRALRQFFGRPPRDALGWGLTAALFAYLLLFSVALPSTLARIVAVSAALGVVAARGAMLLRRNATEECRLSCRFTEAVFWAVTAMTTVRAIGALVAPIDDVLAPQPLNAATFLFYAAFILVSTLGVMWMEIESLQGELVRSARYDSLTGLYNRGTFLAEFEREVSRSARGGPTFSLAIFDLDQFKQINDRYGHPVGDRVLKAFADALPASIRKHDVVGRYGGEEFALLMPQTGKETAVRVAERVRRELEARGVAVDGKRIEVTVSGGIASYGIDGQDWDALLTAADNALYEAKHAGRNRICAAKPPAV
jgi:diguanylate cyclase (GGDEF)-like protein